METAIKYKKEVMAYLKQWLDNYDYSPDEGPSTINEKDIVSYFESNTDHNLEYHLAEEISEFLNECKDMAEHNLMMGKVKSGYFDDELLKITEEKLS